MGFVVAGLVVGFIVGMTGVGGGSLMTPILLWFGINPAAAVGTDLLYAAITKAGGVFVHQRNRNIDWTVTGWLAAGSVPAAALTLLALALLPGDQQATNALIKHALGIVLLLTALAILFKKQIFAFASRHAGDRFHLSAGRLNALTVLTGAVLGFMVTLTSIGGALSALSADGDPAPGRHRDRPCGPPDTGGRARTRRPGQSGLAHPGLSAGGFTAGHLPG